MALTIFSTLNDRGLTLADSDIFKTQIYSTLSNIERTTFTEDWKNLTCVTEQGFCSIDDMFRYYSHILRTYPEYFLCKSNLKKAKLTN